MRRGVALILAAGLLASCTAAPVPATTNPPGTPTPIASASPAASPTVSALPDPNRMVTIAGGGTELGDGGPATEAQFCSPVYVTADSAGNLYVADAGVFCDGPGASTVRKIDIDGIITTIAGTGTPGYSGDGGPATAAQLDVPLGVAVDHAGNVYISDFNNARIRRIDADGIITTFAGTGVHGYSGDGGPATEAEIFGTTSGYYGGLKFDAQGNLFVAEGGSVRRIDPAGEITTVAGTGVAAYSGDGGPATEAKVTALDIAIDSVGNIYMSGAERVRRVAPDGLIETILGGTGSRIIDDIPAVEASVQMPWGLDVDSRDNLYVDEHRVSRIRMIDADGVITTVAGIYLYSEGGSGKFNGDEGGATELYLNEPVSICIGDDDVLYVADTFNERIRAVHFVNAL